MRLPRYWSKSPGVTSPRDADAGVVRRCSFRPCARSAAGVVDAYVLGDAIVVLSGDFELRSFPRPRSRARLHGSGGAEALSRSTLTAQYLTGPRATFTSASRSCFKPPTGVPDRHRDGETERFSGRSCARSGRSAGKAGRHSRIERATGAADRKRGLAPAPVSATSFADALGMTVRSCWPKSAGERPSSARAPEPRRRRRSLGSSQRLCVRPCRKSPQVTGTAPPGRPGRRGSSRTSAGG